MSEEALSGIRVLDLTHHIAGPYCTKLLADSGAEVIKVERPGHGDAARRSGPFPGDQPHLEKSGTFSYLNTNKLGVTLNLKSRRGRAILRELVPQVDVLVENFEPRIMADWGLTYPSLRELNAKLVMTSISNFGQTGPYRDYQATEIVFCALGGLMYITGAHDREPLKMGLSQVQYLAGSYGALATMIALRGTGTTGIGQHVDLSIMECLQASLLSQTSYYSLMGAVLRRNARAGGVFSEILPCEDGHVVLVEGAEWERVTEFLGIPELKNPAFSTLAGRTMHAPDLRKIMSAYLMNKGKQEVFHSAQEWRFSAGMAQTAEDLVACPQLNARGYFVQIEDSQIGRIRLPGPAFKMTGTPSNLMRTAPSLGQDNAEIYGKSLGFSEAQLGKLMAQKVL